jgi:ketosteroid isomerase-like protein
MLIAPIEKEDVHDYTPKGHTMPGAGIRLGDFLSACYDFVLGTNPLLFRRKWHMNHIDTVKKIYAAFGQGNVPAILEHVAENVDWNNQGTAGWELPWHGNFSGRRNVPNFFVAVGHFLDIPVFEPKDFLQTDNLVAVRLRLEMIVKKTGKKVSFDAIHFWTFDVNGKVCAYRHFNDTAAELKAWAA